jgi:hypothetical protein
MVDCFCSLWNYGCSTTDHTHVENTPWPESASELYRSSDSRLSAHIVPTFADRAFYVASVTEPYGRILIFLDRSRYFFFQVTPQFYSRVWMDPVPDPLLLRKSCSAGNRTQTLDLLPGTLTTRPQRRSTFFYITYIDSVRTWQETKYISIL